MSGYRRFVAYVYEYPQGKKGNGKGFIKVEARDGVCRMHYKLNGIYGRESVPTRIYAYVRKNQECRGIFLGNCDLAGDRVEFERELSEENMEGSGYELGDLCGLILLSDSGEMYGSGWDDRPVNLKEIRLPNAETASVETGTIEMKAAEKEELPECTLADAENMENVIEETSKNDEEEEEKFSEEIPRTERRLDPGRAPEQERMPEAEEIPEAGRRLDPGRAPEREGMPETERMPEADRRPEPQRMPNADRMPEQPNFLSFCDNGILDCRKIRPEDLRFLARRDRGLLENKFLRHGFSQYGHLLLGRREEDDRYILGVPGMYDRQEALMAGMFGFPYFKETGGRQNNGRRMGYWYRLIDTPVM